MPTKLRVLVTGATGFLGGRLCRRLVSDGGGLASDVEVTACGRNARIGAELEQSGIAFQQADLADRERMVALCAGKDIVFHSGAFSSPWGRYADFFEANVAGTENVVAGCQQHGVGRLVHVSTPSVYFTGQDQLDVPEDYPLPKPRTHYIKTKLMAEGVVDRAHDQGLAVITLRPRALFGPGDTAIFPRLIKALRHRRLPVLGKGDNVVDLTYIDNVVDSLLDAARADRVHLGKKYNITNGEPTLLWPVIRRLATELELPLPEKTLPIPVALVAAAVFELVHRTVARNSEPRLTRYAVGVLSRNITLDISAAKRDLGYAPCVSVEEGLTRYIAWYKQQPSATGDP